jgi:hypothetical protein
MYDARLASRVVLWFLIAAIGLPPSPAAAAGGRGQWSQVTKLKPDTHVIVAVAGRSGSAEPAGSNVRALEGWLGSADASGLVLRLIEDPLTQPKGTYTRSGDVAIHRERVVQVVVVKEGRPWWAIPLVVAAVAGGIVLCIGALEALADGSTWPEGDDRSCGALALFAAPVVLGKWAYRKIDDVPRSEKVIYQAHRPAGEAGL